MNHHLRFHAEINIRIRVVNMYLHAHHRASLGIVGGNPVDLCYLALIFPVRNRNIRLLAHGDLGQIVFGDGNVHLYLLIALYREQLGSFRNRRALQKSASGGSVCGRRHGGDLGHDPAEFRLHTLLSLRQLFCRLIRGKLRALHIVRLLLPGVRVHNSRLRRGFLSFPAADLFLHIIQLFLLRIDDTLLLLHFLRHGKVADFVGRLADAFIQILDGLLNPLPAFVASGLCQLVILDLKLQIQLVQPFLQIFLFALLVVLQVIFQPLHILLLLCGKHLQLIQPDYGLVVFRLVLIALILGAAVSVRGSGGVQVGLCLLGFQLRGVKGDELLSLLHHVSQRNVHLRDDSAHRRVIGSALFAVHLAAGGNGFLHISPGRGNRIHLHRRVFGDYAAHNGISRENDDKRRGDDQRNPLFSFSAA